MSCPRPRPGDRPGRRHVDLPHPSRPRPRRRAVRTARRRPARPDRDSPRTCGYSPKTSLARGRSRPWERGCCSSPRRSWSGGLAFLPGSPLLVLRRDGGAGRSHGDAGRPVRLRYRPSGISRVLLQPGREGPQRCDDAHRGKQLHLTCYDIKGPQRTEAISFGVMNQFESDTFTITSWDILCEPAQKLGFEPVS